MNINWPLCIALLLILLKQFYKLHLQHKPTVVDYLKSLAVLPLDISFLVVGVFAKAAMTTGHDQGILMCGLICYLIISLIVTVLWRVSEAAITEKLNFRFAKFVSLNLATSAMTLYIALIAIG